MGLSGRVNSIEKQGRGRRSSACEWRAMVARRRGRHRRLGGLGGPAVPLVLERRRRRGGQVSHTREDAAPVLQQPAGADHGVGHGRSDRHGGAVSVQDEACPGEQTAGGALDGPAVIPRRPHVAADASVVRALVDVEHERPVPGCPRPRSGRRQREEDRLARPRSRPVRCVIERRWKMTPSRPIPPRPASAVDGCVMTAKVGSSCALRRWTCGRPRPSRVRAHRQVLRGGP